jgi:hypothetical protein
MSKKKKNKKFNQPPLKIKGPVDPIISQNTISKLSNFQLFGLWVLIALIYYALSYTSSGMYQGEEGVHYINMKEFWHKPNGILGNWAKPGWKLLYVVPSLLGYNFLHFFNGLISSAAGIIAYKILEEKNVKIPWLVIAILFSQFLWIQLAFRNYSELVSSLILVIALLYHNRMKYIVSGLLLSYLLIIRQEWLPFVGLYGLFLLYKKEYVAAFSIALFPVFINMWGWAVHDQPLFYYTNAVSTSESYGDRYPRHGFFHYFKVSLAIFGPISLLGITAYFTSLLNKKFKPDYFLIIPSVGFFLLVCVLNIKDPKIGTSTAGNWRYLLVIAPFIAIMATMGWLRFMQSTTKIKYYVGLGFISILLLAFTTFKHNYIVLNADRDFVLVFCLIATLVFGFLPLSLKTKSFLLVGLSVLFNLIYFKPKVIEGENKAISELVPWLESENIADNHILNTNAMVNFFWDKTQFDFPNGYARISEETVKEAPVGSYIFWESHYTKRTSGLDYQYFQNKPEQFQLIRQVVSDDQRFVMLIFQKKA